MKQFSTLVFLFAFCFSNSLFAQEKPTLSYYLPAANYNPAIPTPASWLGYEVGEWHATHDQLLGYMKIMFKSNSRVEILNYLGFDKEGIAEKVAPYPLPLIQNLDNST